MPKIYLSPSTQEFNPFVIGGNEEYYMNLIADAMIPYLKSSGIQYTRNTPDMTAASSIVQSNQGNYDLHLGIHSNASPEAEAGEARGTEVYYFPTSVKGKEAATIIADNFKNIYPIPDLVEIVPSTFLGEVKKVKAPAAFIEVAYHDNVDDATWIKDNIDLIAKTIVLSLTEYFNIPFVNPQAEQIGIVKIGSGNLNIRSKPSLSAPIIGKAYNGSKITVLGKWLDWYVVNYNGIVGYASANFIIL